MSKRFDNKRLLYILAGLVLVLILTTVFKTNRQRSNIGSKLFDIDTAAVHKIVFIPRKTAGEPFEFVKDGSKWTINQGNVTAKPKSNAVGNILSGILEIKPQSLAAVDRSAFKEYELTDSLATRVTLLGKNEKILADVMIGKFTYRQTGSPYQYGGNSIAGTTYVRISGENKIYSVDGFLALSFSGAFNDWRDNTLLDFKKEDATRITFNYPADSSFVLEFRNSAWFASNHPADSLIVSDYINSLSNIRGENFMDDFRPNAVPVYQLSIEGNNLTNLLVKCYNLEDQDEFVITSGINPETYYKSKKERLFKDLFKPASYFRKP